MKEHQISNIENKCIDISDYTFNKNPPLTYKLKSNVICFFDGIQRKIISLPIALSYPIIYAEYYSDNGNMIDITLAICPFTLVSVILIGKFTATKFIENSCLVITNGTLTFPIIDAYKHNINTKIDVEIKLLRNVFTEYPNCNYLSTELPVNQLIDENYYTNKDIFFDYKIFNNQIHPKTLVYAILYKSSKDQSNKVSIIVGKNSNANNISGFDTLKSGFTKYYSKFESEIHQKLGYVVPVFWFAVNILFDDPKIIFIDN